MKKIFIIIIFSIIFQKNAYSETKKYWIDRDYVCNDKTFNFSLLQKSSDSWMRVKTEGMSEDHIGFGTVSSKSKQGGKNIAWGQVPSLYNDDGKGHLAMFIYNTKTKKLTIKVYFLNKKEMKQLQEAVKIKNRQEKATQIFKLKHKFWRYRIDQGGRFEKGTYTCESR